MTDPMGDSVIPTQHVQIIGHYRRPPAVTIPVNAAGGRIRFFLRPPVPRREITKQHAVIPTTPA